jgi:hypothetical protein
MVIGTTLSPRPTGGFDSGCRAGDAFGALVAVGFAADSDEGLPGAAVDGDASVVGVGTRSTAPSVSDRAAGFGSWAAGADNSAAGREVSVSIGFSSFGLAFPESPPGSM